MHDRTFPVTCRLYAWLWIFWCEFRYRVQGCKAFCYTSRAVKDYRRGVVGKVEFSMRNRQIKLLWVSPMAPYNAVGHAGGKTDNFYVKSFSRDAQFDVTLLTYALGQEAPIVRKEFLECEIKAEIIEHPSSFVGRLFWKGMNAETVLNPFNRYAGLTRNHTAIRLMRRLNKIKEESGYIPNILF